MCLHFGQSPAPCGQWQGQPPNTNCSTTYCPKTTSHEWHELVLMVHARYRSHPRMIHLNQGDDGLELFIASSCTWLTKQIWSPNSTQDLAGIALGQFLEDSGQEEHHTTWERDMSHEAVGLNKDHPTLPQPSPGKLPWVTRARPCCHQSKTAHQFHGHRLLQPT